MVGHERLYQVSERGLVWSLRRRLVLKPFPSNAGYLHIALHKDGRQRTHYIHKMVARAFHGECPEGLEVLHKDGNRQDNSKGNLRYGTHAENVQDSVRHGTHVSTRKKKCPQGHPLDGLIKSGKGAGKRYCKQCNRDRRMARYAADPEGEKKKMRDYYRGKIAA